MMRLIAVMGVLLVGLTTIAVIGEASASKPSAKPKANASHYLYRDWAISALNGSNGDNEVQQNRSPGYPYTVVAEWRSDNHHYHVGVFFQNAARGVRMNFVAFYPYGSSYVIWDHATYERDCTLRPGGGGC